MDRKERAEKSRERSERTDCGDAHCAHAVCIDARERAKLAKPASILERPDFGRVDCSVCGEETDRSEIAIHLDWTTGGSANICERCLFRIRALDR